MQGQSDRTPRPTEDAVHALDSLAAGLAEEAMAGLGEAGPLTPAQRAYALTRTAEALVAQAEMLLPPFERGDRTVRWLKWVLQALRQRLQRDVEMGQRLP